MARILIVDDESNIRMMIQMALERDGHAVETAADGAEGVWKFGDGSGWDLVLLDQRMPLLEGLEALREMRRRDPLARIIMLTAFGTVDLAVDAMKAGATDFLRKPFTLPGLRGAVQAALRTDAEPATSAGAGTVVRFLTLNGFQVESRRAAGMRVGTETAYRLAVRSPAGELTPCVVTIPAYVMELAKAQADRDEMPGGDYFWQGFAEEALANYVWQNAAAPPDGSLRVVELTTSLKRWTDAVLAARR